MKHIFTVEEKDGKLNYIEHSELKSYVPMMIIDLPDDTEQNKVEQEMFWAADNIYREIKRHYLMQDIMSESKSLGKELSVEEAEDVADWFERKEDCSISYWSNIDSAMDGLGL